MEQLAAYVEVALGASILAHGQSPRQFKSQAHKKLINKTNLWHCSYEIPIRLRFPDSDYIRIQFPYRGAGATTIGGESVQIAGTSACISSGAVDIDFGRGFRQIVWQIPRDVIAQKMTSLIGEPLPGRFDFSTRYDVSNAHGQGVMNILMCIIRCLDAPAATTPELALAELEQALITALLGSATHGYSHVFESKTSRAAPWQVHRAECYMEANWNRPLAIENIAEATGASIRSLFRTFKEYRGYTPMDFLKRLRLKHAMNMLSGDEGHFSSVTEVAFACGFSDLSGFSKTFSTAYGESPSAALRRTNRFR